MTSRHLVTRQRLVWLVLLAGVALAGWAQKGRIIAVDGSSTVYPITEAVA